MTKFPLTLNVLWPTSSALILYMMQFSFDLWTWTRRPSAGNGHVSLCNVHWHNPGQKVECSTGSAQRRTIGIVSRFVEFVFLSVGRCLSTTPYRRIRGVKFYSYITPALFWGEQSHLYPLYHRERVLGIQWIRWCTSYMTRNRSIPPQSGVTRRSSVYWAVLVLHCTHYKLNFSLHWTWSFECS